MPKNTLARMCGVSWWELHRVEAGEVEPRGALVARLVEVTGLPFDRLLGARGHARLERFRAAAEPEASGKGGRPRGPPPWPRGVTPENDPDVMAFVAELRRQSVSALRLPGA